MDIGQLGAEFRYSLYSEPRGKTMPIITDTEEKLFHALAGAEMAFGDISALIRQGLHKEAKRDAEKAARAAFKILDEISKQ